MQAEKRGGLSSGACQPAKETEKKQPLRWPENQEGVVRKCRGGRDHQSQKLPINEVG